MGRFLNEGLVCEAIRAPRMGVSPDGRGTDQEWKCGLCRKRGPNIQTMLRLAEKQCDYCLATNTFDFNQPAKPDDRHA